MEFKNRLKSLRRENDLTQKNLASILNYGYTAISNYESGRNEPSIKDLKKIACYFNVSLDYLVGVNNIKNPYNESQYSEAIEEFQALFTGLDEPAQQELFLFMKWILERQLVAEPEDKVAELSAAYIASQHKLQKNSVEDSADEDSIDEDSIDEDSADEDSIDEDSQTD